MTETEIKTRSPIDFMDCLTILRRDGCIGCSRRNERLGNWETCRVRIGLKYEGQGSPANR